MAVDYYTLNAQTIPDRHSIPHINDILNSFYQAHYFSKLDLLSGYHQIRMEESHQCKTAFLFQWGLYEYTVNPLELTNAPANFEHLMNCVLYPYLDWFAAVY